MEQEAEVGRHARCVVRVVDVQMLADADREWLEGALRGGEVVLFTGAGFSAGAADLRGRALPLGKEMAIELEEICFGRSENDSALQDLYDVAAEHHRAELAEYLGERLRVGDAPLPDHYGLWFVVPWARVYTLNVDDLELAAARQFALPRRPVPISAIPPRSWDGAASAPARRETSPSVLEVIHLNGLVGNDLDSVTFSTLQYATRLVDGCPYYAELTADLAARPFIFVGTALDEALFWQHLQLRRARGEPTSGRPRSFLVTPRLSRARQVLLEGLNIEWIPAAAEAFAEEVLRRLVSHPARRNV